MALEDEIVHLITALSNQRGTCWATEKSKRRMNRENGHPRGERSISRKERQMEREGKLERKRVPPGGLLPTGKRSSKGTVLVRVRSRQELHHFQRRKAKEARTVERRQAQEKRLAERRAADAKVEERVPEGVVRRVIGIVVGHEVGGHHVAPHRGLLGSCKGQSDAGTNPVSAGDPKDVERSGTRALVTLGRGAVRWVEPPACHDASCGNCEQCTKLTPLSRRPFNEVREESRVGGSAFLDEVTESRARDFEEKRAEALRLAAQWMEREQSPP